MKLKQLKKSFITLSCIFFSHVTLLAAIHYVSQPGKIMYNNNCRYSSDETWIIDLGVNKYLNIYCIADQPSNCSYIAYHKYHGTVVRNMMADPMGISFYTVEQNGKAIIHYVSDGGFCESDTYYGFLMIISVDNRNYNAGDQIFTGNSVYFLNNVAFGNAFVGEASFPQPFNVSGNSYFKGNVGIGHTSPTQKLSVSGAVSISVSSSFYENYKGALMLSKPNGQFINLVRNTSESWSIGMVYNTNKFAIGQSKTADTQFTSPFLTITPEGKVGIGTVNPQYLLDVKGSFRATEIIAEPVSAFADFVFRSDYKLPSLPELNRFIRENGHLPDIPTESEVKENGLNITDMQIKLLQKVEELTLYIIQLEEKISKLDIK
jgi:hypothetical protein